MFPKRILKRKKKQKDRADTKKRKLDNGEEVVAVDAGADEMAIDQPEAAEAGDDAGDSKEVEDDVEKAKKEVEEMKKEVEERKKKVEKYASMVEKLVLKEDRTDKEDKRMRLLEKLKREAIQEKDKAIQERNHAEERLDRLSLKHQKDQKQFDTLFLQEWKKYVEEVRKEEYNPDVEVVPCPTYRNQRVYVRECYKIFWEYICGGKPGNVILGTPGIGKSLFVYYCIYLLLHKMKKGEVEKIIVFRDSQDIISVTSDEVVMRKDVTIKNAIDDCAGNPKMWIFVDALMIPQLDREFSCHVIQTTSPQREMWSRFYKEVNYVWKKYMPLFTLKELEVCNDKCNLGFSKAEIKKEYEIWGGSARNVFRKEKESLNEMKAAVTRLVSLKPLNIAKYDYGEKGKIVHRIIHLDPIADSDYGFCEYKFCSDQAEVDYIRKVRAQNVGILVELVKTEDIMLSTVRGRIFESLCHATMESEQKLEFDIRNLEVSGSKPTKLTLEFKCSKTYQALSEVELDEGVYYKPVSQTEPAIDALYRDGCFQYTINQNHGYKKASVERIRDHYRSVLRDPDFVLRLYLVVPIDALKDVGKQRYEGGDQKSVVKSEKKMGQGKKRRMNDPEFVLEGCVQGVEQYVMGFDMKNAK